MSRPAPFVVVLWFLAILLPCPLVTGCSAAEAPPADTDPRVDNLYAFARLYGYVRYFHPSDAVAALDWDPFAIHGARRVVGADSADDLRTTLQELFAPIAPTVQIYTEGSEPPPPPAELTPEDAADLDLVAWQHRGLGLGNQGPYASGRLGRPREELSAPVCIIGQSLEVEDLRGHDVRFEGTVRAEVEGESRAQLWLRVDREDRQMGFFDNMDDRPITSPDWQTYRIEGTVADDAVRIALGAFLAGEGDAYLDDLRLLTRAPGAEAWVPRSLSNAGFETTQDGALPPGWNGGAEGFSVSTLAAPDAPEGEWLAHITRDPLPVIPGQLFAQHPTAGEVIDEAIGRGLRVRVPLTLHSRDGATLRPADAPSPDALRVALEEIATAEASPEDEAVRAAGVTIAWNVFQHFYPYFDVVDVDWEAVLRTSLGRALDDATAGEFLDTLRLMVADLQDGHGGVFTRAERDLAGVALGLAEVEGQVVVTAVPEDAVCVQRGDVVRRIDGRPAGELLDEGRARNSGTRQWTTWRAIRRLTYGEAGSQVVLTLDRAGSDGSEVTCELERASRDIVPDVRPESFADLGHGIAYVDLTRTEIGPIMEQIDELAAAPGVIFDLRGYPRGNHRVLQHLADEPLQSARWQVPQIIYPDHRRLVGYDTTGRWHLEPQTPRFTGEVVFLTDGRAISYAETVMGIVEHHRLGEIVGAPTAGTNGNVNPFNLPGGYRVAWTGMRVLKHDGAQHHLEGIQPTVLAAPTIEGIRAGRDEVLERATALIRERID